MSEDCKFYYNNNIIFNPICRHPLNMGQECNGKCNWYSKSCKPNPPKDKQIGGSHYQDFKIQPKEFFLANNLPFFEASVIKYVCRYKSKNGKEDLQKAIHCLEILIEENYG